jgi:prepilin-type N-terminal cleavage/methylation domain-containing protein
MKTRTRGFTIIELIVVIFVIGTLAAITILAYGAVTKNANDKAVLSDVDSLDGLEGYLSTHNNNGGVSWYSGASGTNGVANATLQFTATKGDVIDVVTSSTDYCIRAYNPNAATYNSLATAAAKGSTSTACATLTASTPALIDSGVPPTYSAGFESGLAGWSSGHGNNTVSSSSTMAHTGTLSAKSVQNTFWYTNDVVHCGNPMASCGFSGDGLRNTLTSLSIGQSYTISVWVYTDDTANTRSVYWDPITGATMSSGTPVTLVPHTWNKVQATIVPTSSSVYIYLYITTPTNPPTDTITTYIDDITLF